MDSILHALGSLILKALPTLLLVGLLHLYLKLVFFKPLGRVLDARYRATEGARKLAEESLARVTAKTAEYEEALRAARAEIYQSQERAHQRLEQERTARLAEARAESEATLKAAKDALAADVAAAKVALARETETLAQQIADAILEQKAA
jgi:F-type H+-transporting ATPase subunit b